jgi:LmbE family N-acetylglucosaminyl deacetylase
MNRLRRSSAFTLVLTGLLAQHASRIAAAEQPSAAAILQELRNFHELGSILHVAAHPDDENTQLITYFARGRGFRAAYLSITRGDGGQNVLGPEFDEELGLIRTHELLAARRLDGGQQFFTRAVDFGFSKDYAETLKIWDREQVVGDVVRVIRTFQPDVMVTRFSLEPGGTHGHHTASAVLALEAFRLAGNPNAYPEQLKGDIVPWQPKRIVINGGGGRGGQRGPGVQQDVGGNDPVLNQSFAEIAGRSRAMHKSQGFGDFGGRGGGGGPRMESFQHLAGDPTTKDLFDDVDTTWSRVPGGAEIGRLVEEAIKNFKSDDPSTSVPALLAIRAKLADVPASRLVDDKRRKLDQLLQHCLGLTVETTAQSAEVVPGEDIKLTCKAAVQSKVPVQWTAVQFPATAESQKKTSMLAVGQPETREVAQTLPAKTELSQPYWLREAHVPGLYSVADATFIGTPINPPAFPVEYVFEVGGQTLTIPDAPAAAAKKDNEQPRPLEAVSPVSLSFDFEVQLFKPGATRPVEVEISAIRDNVSGKLMLNAPGEWHLEPQSQPFNLAKVGDRKKLSFAVMAPPQAASTSIAAVAEVGGKNYDSRRAEINYPHIPHLLLQPPARLRAVALDFEIRGKTVGYLPGAGDSVAESLEQMGYKVKRLTGDDLTETGLQGLDAVVVGIRAFNTRTDLAPHMANLFKYVEDGGTLIEQYNRPNGLKTEKLSPLDLQISGLRVTDENAPMTLLAPDHPVLNKPNKITSADFEGWVQERGLYFPNRWDERFTPILACSDPGETALDGGILVAKHGRGNFIYTPLAWFRQLPAGVPGAYRLFANLVSLGKE